MPKDRQILVYQRRDEEYGKFKPISKNNLASSQYKKAKCDNHMNLFLLKTLSPRRFSKLYFLINSNIVINTNGQKKYQSHKQQGIVKAS